MVEPVRMTEPMDQAANDPAWDDAPFARVSALEDKTARDDLDEVYRRSYPSLVRTAYLLVDTRELAEEIVQDAFAKAYPRWERLTTPEAYLRTCVINGCRRVHRRRRLIARLPERRVDADRLDEGDHLADVRALPSPQREAIVLRYYLQATDQEIADTLGLAVGTVKSTLHRARTRLREELT